MGLHVGIIGSGLVGRVHLEAMLAHETVSAVSLAEPAAALRQKAASELPIRLAVADYHALLDDPSIDVVDICLPHDLHHRVALEAFAAGKHVLTDKPISNTLPEADGMIAAAEASGRRFYVALNQRFMPVHQRVRQLLDDGTIGREFMATLTVIGSELPRMSDPDSWKGTWDRAGGGVLADSGTHVVDLAHDWFGPPTAVACRLARHVVKTPNKADDTCVLTLEYPDLTVALLLTYGAAGQGWSETRQIWSETGSLHVRLEDADPMVVWKDGRRLPQEVTHEPDWWAWSVGLGLAHALDRLADDQPFAVDPSDAREALRTIQAAYKSAELGQRVLMAEYGVVAADTAEGADR